MKHAGQLELTWTGKDKALLSVGDGKYDYTFVDPADYRVSEVRLLHEVDRLDVEAPAGAPEGVPEPTTDNLLITGDAMHVLDALRAIPEYADKYLGKIKLCYIDPPFNTGQTFVNYEDNIEHSIWLTMLRDRLQQIKPLLSEDGSVWVHLDDTESHRCRIVLDEVMGSSCFAGELIWRSTDNSNNDSKTFSSDHNTILVYGNSASWRSKRLPDDGGKLGHYKNPDNDPRGPWFDGNPLGSPNPRKNLQFNLTSPQGVAISPPPNGWRWSQETLQRKIETGEIRFTPDGKGIRRRTYLLEQGGLPPSSLWSDISKTGSNRKAKSQIKRLFPGKPAAELFPTPKPEELLRLIVDIATEPGDIVLDCFGGSGTTAAVTQKMGRRWVTSELSAKNVETYIKPRLLKVIRGEDTGGVSCTTKRVAAMESGLLEGISPKEAQDFNRLLNKLKKELDGLDSETLQALSNATKTRDEKVINWVGGGGFTHLRVGESMFEEVDGRVYLADWAVNGALTEAMCAQLGVRYRPDGIFGGKSGTVRLVVVNGMVTSSTVCAILDQLPEGEIVHVWATQIDADAAEQLRNKRPGSQLLTIPESVLDTYRRKAVERFPFAPKQPIGEQ